MTKNNMENQKDLYIITRKIKKSHNEYLTKNISAEIENDTGYESYPRL